MRCISPINIKDPSKLGQGKRIDVPCGKCIACNARKRADWSFRLHQEHKICTSAWFYTLTYDEDQVPKNENGIAQLSKRDIQLFMKKLRNEVAKITSEKVRYYIVGEYGPTTNRPHYHGLIFNVPKDLMLNSHDIWTKGNIEVGNVTPKSIHYVTKYINKRNVYPKDTEKPFSLMSRNPGIGSNYLINEGMHKKAKLFGVQYNGYQQPIPRYYKDKIFSDGEKKAYNEQSEKSQDIAFWKEYNRIIALNENYAKREQESIQIKIDKEEKESKKLKRTTI